MAEITKITTPIVPKENTAGKFKPVTDQAFDLTDPGKVHRADQEGKAASRQTENQSIIKDAMGRSAIIPLLKNTGDMMQVLKKVAFLIESGVSAADAAKDADMKELLESLFVSRGDFSKTLMEQDKASLLFKGDAFDVLRDIMDRFGNNVNIKDSLAALLKAFDYNVNTQNSIKTILYNCSNILGYMFTKDREQFTGYLQGLADMMLSEKEAVTFLGLLGRLPAEDTQIPGEGLGQESAMASKEMAQILKNNLLPLLGEIVVKYHQNEKIRDTVMVVVHNIVRVDQGSPEKINDAVGKLIKELKQLANVPEGFEKQLTEALKNNIDIARNTPNSVISKLSDIISQTLHSPDANPAILRQAENMLISMLQNQSALMDVTHFLIPLNTPEGPVFTELYVDPETDEKAGNKKGRSHKIFISVETEAHGSFELSFLETAGHVDFTMWCPDDLVKSLSGLKRQFGDIMQLHGYTMNSFKIDEMKAPHSVAEVFPRLLEKKVGFDVQV